MNTIDDMFFYQNPILKGYADPDVYYENGIYYLYATSTYVKKGYEVYTSPDLIHWVRSGMALEEAWDFKEKYWAPDVKKIGNSYVMAASVNEHLGLAVARHPEGPFIPQENWLFDCSIDGHLFLDVDGRLYLYYVSWREGHIYGLYGCQLDIASLKPVPNSERLLLTPTESYELQLAPVVEAPYMLCKGGQYFLTYSGSHFESPNYCVAAAVSDFPLGEFKRCSGNPILLGDKNVSGCGHHCIVRTPVGELYLLYHTHAFPGRQIHPRQLALDKLHWEGEQLVTSGPSITPQLMPIKPVDVMPLELSPLKNKRLLFLGSSVTYGSAAGGISMADCIRVIDDCTVIKEAVSGTTLADKGLDSYFSRLKKVDTNQSFDAVICQLSTNDAAQKIPLGVISEYKDLDAFETATVAGAMEAIIAYIQDNWRCPIIFYTGTRYDCIEYQAMVNLLPLLKEKWGIYILDLWNDAEMNSVTEDKYALYMSDGIHPTAAGYLFWWTPKFQRCLYELFDVAG